MIIVDDKIDGSIQNKLPVQNFSLKCIIVQPIFVALLS